MRPVRPSWRLGAIALLAQWLEGAAAASGPSVNVAMKAAFPSAPYLIELLETAALENATSYFPLLDRIAEGYFAQQKTDKSLYESFLDLLQRDGHMASPETLSTFKLAVAMRRAAPRIEAHYQYFETGVEAALEGSGEVCAEWVIFDNRRYCSPSLEDARGHLTGNSQSRTLPFDRELGHGAAVNLYADVTLPAFGQFHRFLAEKARKGEITYRLRYKRSKGHSSEPLPVAGYGVELALKKTDYIVIDDREAAPKESSGSQAVLSADSVLDGEEAVADLKPLSTSELLELGLKSASFIMQSEKPFETLIKLTQDFPKYSGSIAAHEVSSKFLAEHSANRAALAPSGVNVLWANGLQLIERQIESFTLVDILRRERKLINGVRELGLSGREAVALLGHREVTSAKTEDEQQRFDWRDELEEGQVILWLNNLELDERYADFPSNLYSLLQRTYPGQIPPIRRDIFNLVVPANFADAADVALVADQLQSFVERGVPLRFGIVPLTPTQGAADQAKVVYYFAENYGLTVALSYLVSSYTSQHTASPDKDVFDATVKEATLLEDGVALPFEDIFTAESYAKHITQAKNWADRMKANTPTPPVFIDGLALARKEGWLQTMSMNLGQDLQVIQQALFTGVIGEEETWIPGYFLQKASTRRNLYIVPEDGKAVNILDMHRLYSENAALFAKVPVIEANVDSSKENWAVLTVLADLGTETGQKLLVSALQFRSNNPGVRLDILHNPLAVGDASELNSRLKAAESRLTDVDALGELQKVLETAANDGEPDNGYGLDLAAFRAATSLSGGSQFLVLNGRVVGPILPDDSFSEDDMQHLLEFERSNRILPVYAAIDALGLNDKVLGPLAAAKLTSVTALSSISDLPEGIFESAPTLRMTAFDDWNSTYTSFEVGDRDSASIHFVALLNPASEQGQRWAPILKVLSELEGVYLRVFLNPRETLEELPIKRFFRYVLDSAPSFDAAGKVKALGATFTSLPSEALLTAGMNIPPAWLVAAKDSVQDLDNIKLSSVKANVEATYELENILIEGHSREPPNGGAPKGAQLVLATESNPQVADTIVMANLGYFQFKANPGYYNIQTKKGRSSDIFQIESVGAKGFSPVAGDEGTEVALMDFQGATLYPRIGRKPGMEDANVLEEAGTAKAADGGPSDLLSKGLKFAEGFFGGSAPPKTKSASDEEHAEINIFSVASGHLYERMLNIMMVSVMKHTNHTVKFWFIEQFLSPSFKDFIPHMAAEYGFKYEMVTFKWPHWLRQQKEKQREIWGYKILFLDVLFPLSLDKVIFVDADQIVRTDMMELVKLDLEGAPYGFTPMCDSRTEMEGFRFWKTGYWKNYLKGLPYHISALYVVDLRRFRELAAGDRLRQQYHSLSADPHSLSNLDQDLPNHMQFVIPIRSLPQEWLWCETWCSDESLAEARTIDLCNNPLTKEPKLDRARRQVPEWTVYDDEIAAVDARRKAKAKSKAKVTGEDGGQKVLKPEEKNTKSRTLEETVETKTREKDEL